MYIKYYTSMETPFFSRKTKFTLFLTVVVLFFVFILAEAYSFKNNSHPFLKNYIANHRHRPTLLRDPSYISSWMTFDYINKVFNIPPQYFEVSLQIQDPKYPFITIKQYARKINLPDTVLLERVREAIRGFLVIPKP